MTELLNNFKKGERKMRKKQGKKNWKSFTKESYQDFRGPLTRIWEIPKYNSSIPAVSLFPPPPPSSFKSLG